MATVQVRQVVEYLLANPKIYAGLHTTTQPRTSQGLPQLDPTRQMLLVWDAMCAYIQEVLHTGKSLNIRHFGAFTSESILTGGGNSKNPRGHALKLRPCFLVADDLRETLYRYPGKEEMHTQAGSMYQKGPKMNFLNCTPIAAGTYLKEPVVDSCVRAFFKATLDLATRGYNLNLDFRFGTVKILNRNLHVYFDSDFTDAIQSVATKWPKFEHPPLADTWKKKGLSNAMMNFHQRPNSRESMRQKNRTMQLGILSLDLNSCTATPKAFTAR
jgi:hypothetical protein